MNTYEFYGVWRLSLSEPMSPLDRAKDMLRHYFCELAEKSNLEWGPGNDEEIGQIINLVAQGIHESRHD